MLQIVHLGDDPSKKCKLHSFISSFSRKNLETTSHMKFAISMSKMSHRYAIVDYGRGNFSISQSAMNNQVPNIIVISNTNDTGSSNAGYIVGTVIAGIILLAILIVIACASVDSLLERRRKIPLEKRLKELDRIWIQIHSVGPEKDGEEEEGEQEGEEEVGILEH